MQGQRDSVRVVHTSIEREREGRRLGGLGGNPGRYWRVCHSGTTAFYIRRLFEFISEQMQGSRRVIVIDDDRLLVELGGSGGNAGL